VNKFGIGQPVPRVEDPRFITGRGRYVDDIDLPHLCYGVVVMSPHAHARIKRVDTAKAKAADGVLAVLTGADVKADQLGGLALTLEGLERRDRLVFEFARKLGIPVMCTLAGGYARSVDDTVRIHVNTVRAAAEVARRYPHGAHV